MQESVCESWWLFGHILWLFGFFGEDVLMLMSYSTWFSIPINFVITCRMIED